jgi:hypothetical protein
MSRDLNAMGLARKDEFSASQHEWVNEVKRALLES